MHLADYKNIFLIFCKASETPITASILLIIQQIHVNVISTELH